MQTMQQHTVKGVAVPAKYTKAITVRMTPQMHQQLAKDGRQIGLTPASMARAYIKMALDRRTDVSQIVDYAETGEGGPVVAQIPRRDWHQERLAD